jgi:hypothetical protein
MTCKHKPSISAEDLSRLAALNSKDLPHLINDNGCRKRWVGIGWVDEGDADGSETKVVYEQEGSKPKRKPYDPKKRAQQRYNLQNRRVRSILSDLIDIYRRRGPAEQWSHDRILSERTARVFKHPAWDKLPFTCHQYIMGADDVLMQLYWEHVEFSYVINGERLRLSDPKYRAFPPQDVDCSTGAYVYKVPPHNLFTKPKGKPDGDQRETGPKSAPEKDGPTVPLRAGG